MSIPDEITKKTYSDVLDRMGYFCTICETEQQNANGLVAFQSTETVQQIFVCHDCLPGDFE